MQKLKQNPTRVVLFDDFNAQVFVPGAHVLLEHAPLQKITVAEKVAQGVRIKIPLGTLLIPLPPPPEMHHFIKGVALN